MARDLDPCGGGASNDDKMRLRLGASKDGTASVVVLDPASKTWVSLIDAAKGAPRGERWPYGDGPLRDVTAFLGLGREGRRVAAALAAAGAASLGSATAPATKLPIKVESFRDAGLYVRHMKQASKGFFPVALKNGHAVQLALGQLLAKALRLPRTLGPCGAPPFYVGNPRTVVADGATARWPSYVGWMDYELEVALINGATLGDDPTEGDCEEAILDYGAFVLINDFSARDVQADEIASVGFGFVKCKGFCTAMGSDVVTADELWMPGDYGKLFCGEGLACEVRVNGETWGEGAPGNTAEKRCCLLSDYVKHVALGEGLVPGEVLGLGTVPGCAGVEIGKWLRPGDEITVSCDVLGSVTTKLAVPRDGPNFKDLGRRSADQPSRLASALTFLKLAVVAPPLVFVAMAYGALASLFWAGPPTPPGLAPRAGEEATKKDL